MRHNGILSIIFLVLASVMPGPGNEISAQNLSSATNNNLESAYQRAMTLRQKAEGMALADSLYRIALIRGDKEMQTKLLEIPVYYFISTKDEKKLEEACEKLREVARRNKDEKRRFWSYRQQAMYLVGHDKIYGALDIAEKMRADAEATKSYMEMYLTYLTLGDVYKAQNDKDLSLNSYKKALRIQQQFLKDIDATMIRVNLAEMYRRKSNRQQSDIDSCRLMIAKGLAETTDSMGRAYLYKEEAMLNHSLCDFEGFKEAYDHLAAQFDTDTLPDEFLQVSYRKLLLDGDYDGAKRLIDRMPSDYDKHIAMYLLHKRRDDYKSALAEYEKANHALNVIRQSERKGNIEQLNKKIENLLLEKENSELKAQEALNDRKFSYIIGGVMLVIFVIVLVALYFVSKLWNQAKKAGEELKVKNLELEQARDKAVRSEAMKTMFIQNMSHEIRTPLNAIVGFSEVLATQAEELDATEREQYNNLIQHNNDLLTILVNDILTLSDIDNGTYELDITKVNVNRLCRNVLQSVKHRLQENVALEFDTDVSNKFEIETDEARLTQVLNNLLVNACKYTTEGKISLECAIKGGQVVFAVRDTGPGIPQERRKEIFERFTKLDNFHQGTGLGLNICRTIVDMMKGHIYVDDEYTGGSRFVVKLPVFQ